MTPFARLGRGLGDLLFPPSCVACAGLVESNEPFRHVCAPCLASIHRVSSPHCPLCGHPFFGEVEEDRVCGHCRGLDPAFNEGFTAVLFKGPARALILELKYRHGLHVLADMGELVRSVPRFLVRLVDAVLVPVPLHPRKLRERGYNQSELLAVLFARLAGGTTRVESVLRRVVDTQTQTAFDRRARRRNLKNAFALRGRTPIVPDQRYILVDGVFTTGSTLNSCAQVLRAAGVLNVDVVTFGHG